MPINRLLTPFNRHTYCRLRNAKLLCQNTLADTKLAHGPITYDTTSLHDFFILTRDSTSSRFKPIKCATRSTTL
jgi:hypothetical protein